MEKISSHLVLETLQNAGLMHITPITEVKSKQAKIKKLIELEQFLISLAIDGHEKIFDDNKVNEILSLKKDYFANKDKTAKIKKTIDLYQPFGQFNESLDLSQAGLRLELAILDEKKFEELKEQKLDYQLITYKDKIYYVAILCKKDDPVLFLHPPEKSISQMTTELLNYEDKAQKIIDKIKEYNLNIENIRNEYKLLNKIEEGKQVEQFVGFSGYILAQDTDRFKSLLQNKPVAIKIEEPSPKEDVPVKLKNPKLVRGFEAIIRSFSGINYFEKDKTTIIAWLFIFFGSLCLLDAGYGLLLFLSGYFLSRKNQKEFGQVFMLTGGFTTILGLLCGQIFGLQFAKDILLDIPPLFSLATDAMVCFKFSLAVGLLSMALTNLFSIYQDGAKNHALGSFLIIIAGLILIVEKANGINTQPYLSIPLVLMSMGFLCWLIFPEPVFGHNHIANVLWMLYSGPIGILQDVLSHMRLFGIALSGSILAMVINKIAMLLPYFLGLIFAPFGHFIVFLLSLLSLYIHTNRLIFLEFGSKCMRGGHNFFTPFKRE